MNYKTTIGLEIHAELKTKTKMFCSCKNNPREKQPNVNICPICLGHPGTLPVINKRAMEMVVKTGLALNCDIAKRTYFERKNYFYPDLPKGYQISQSQVPLCKDGYLELQDFEESFDQGKSQISNSRRIRINNIHLEEDTGSSMHPQEADYSLVDFNRAGIPLMELVTEPDISSAVAARKFAEELQLVFRYLDISFADMERGEMRVEVNISLSQTKELGTKVEIKNLNSFRAIEKAIKYEEGRQAKILDRGEKVVQETRGFDEKQGITFSQRVKEESYDYRYFPEPDLPVLCLKS